MKIQHFTICIALVFFLSAGASAQDALDLPMNREGSGTAWQPDSTPMYAKGFMLGGWSMMAGELAFGGYDYQGSRRGAGQVFSTNWAMLMAEHELLGGELGARLMMSGEEFTDGGRGYPLLLQSGEEFHGVPNHDRQHPHDLFMEMAATYAHSITKDLGLELVWRPGWRACAGTGCRAASRVSGRRSVRAAGTSLDGFHACYLRRCHRRNFYPQPQARSFMVQWPRA